jgi:hypothetical protein
MDQPTSSAMQPTKYFKTRSKCTFGLSWKCIVRNLLIPKFYKNSLQITDHSGKDAQRRYTALHATEKFTYTI